jgi:hypothetical protein
MTATGAGPVMAAATRMAASTRPLHVVVLTRLRMTQRPAPTLSCGVPRQDQPRDQRCLVRYAACQLFRLLEREAGSWFVV